MGTYPGDYGSTFGTPDNEQDACPRMTVCYTKLLLKVNNHAQIFFAVRGPYKLTKFNVAVAGNIVTGMYTEDD